MGKRNILEKPSDFFLKSPEDFKDLNNLKDLTEHYRVYKHLEDNMQTYMSNLFQSLLVHNSEIGEYLSEDDYNAVLKNINKKSKNYNFKSIEQYIEDEVNAWTQYYTAICSHNIFDAKNKVLYHIYNPEGYEFSFENDYKTLVAKYTRRFRNRFNYDKLVSYKEITTIKIDIATNNFKSFKFTKHGSKSGGYY